MDAPSLASVWSGSVSQVSAAAGSRRTTGTVQGSRVGTDRAACRGVRRMSSGESSGVRRSDGRRSSALPGSAGTVFARLAAGTANGCGRAVRSAWLGLVTGSSESSAHSPSPVPDQ